MNDRRSFPTALLGAALLCSSLPSHAQVTKYLYEFDTLGSGHPNDLINDQPALLKAAAFFQARNGYGTLILEDGEYIVGQQELHWEGDAYPGPDWTAYRYPSGVADSVPHCPALVAVQPGFTLHDCAQFTVRGGANTTMRYRDCLYYGTFFRTAGTDEVFSAAGADSCHSCLNALHSPDLLHANVGSMFSFYHCDSITVRDLELNGNMDGAILGGRSSDDGIQTEYDGILLYESSNCEINHVDAHHFGRDGLLLWGTYLADSLHIFTDEYPDLAVVIDPIDTADTTLSTWRKTVLFNNRVLGSSFNWNGRQGISWTALSGLDVSNCHLNYNGAGRMTSSPGSGLDIEGAGGPIRVRHGIFSDCNFLHNRAGGVITFDDPCLGQQDFIFTNCTIKAGTEGIALWPTARGMRFFGCEIHGRVEELFEQAENISQDTSFNLVFRNTNFYEEDDQWSYLGDYPDSTWAADCGGGPNKVDMVGVDRAARVAFDSCGFFTNCRGKVRFAGRSTLDTQFPYCPNCDTCAQTYLGTDTAQDARYMTITNCTFRNTGRMKCTATTEVLRIDLATVDGFTIDIPSEVRGGGVGDSYWYPFGQTTWALPSCYPAYCDWDSVIVTDYAGEFPPCLPFFTLPDTIPHWDLCDPDNNVLVQACSSDANCYSDRVIPDSALASSIGTVLTGTVDVQGLFIVDNDFTFSGADVRMEPGAEILVQAGASLELNGSTLGACQGIMWKSITVASGGALYSYSSFIHDAENAVTALDGSTLVVNNTQFHNDRVGIDIPEIAGVPWNSVSMAITNNIFYSNGPLAVPYPGQVTTIGQQGYAAICVARTTLDLGGGNLIHDLSNGVVGLQSDVHVSDCDFQNIQPDAAYTDPTNGAAIQAYGASGFFLLDQTSSLFTNCRWGIHTAYMNVYSAENTMVDVGTAYHVERSGYRDVDILNNTLDTRYDAIQLFMNDGAAHLLVQDNDITFATNPPPGTLTKGYTAINVREANTTNLSSVITNNTIHYRTGVSTARTGIGLTAANDYKILDNTLLMSNNASNYAGITTSGCSRPLISCNTVTGSFSFYGLDPGQSAIRNNMGKAPSIYCNTVDGTTNGIYFSGPAYDTDLSGNNIKNHKWGLHLDNTAIIEQQYFKGNLWYFPPVTGGWGAIYDNPGSALAFRFRVAPSITVPGSNPMPPTWSPSYWFLSVAGTNYQCNDGATDYCSQFDHERCEDCKTELDEKIAADSLQNNPYTPETQWIMKGDLYSKLHDHPDMMDDDQELADYYATIQNTALAQFKELSDDQLALYDLDATVRTYLQENRLLMEDLMTQLKAVVEQLGDESLTDPQRQAILADIAALQVDINALASLNAQAIELAANSRVLSAENAKAANASIGTSEVIDQTEKAVNEIFLSTVAKDIDDFTSDQASELFDLANQCPLIGGNAVYRARSLYALVDDDQEFDDPALCLDQGIVIRSVEQTIIPAVMIIPNPASDRAVLICETPLFASGELVLRDALGREALRIALLPETTGTEFNTAALKPGPYHFEVECNGQQLGDGKFVVVR